MDTGLMKAQRMKLKLSQQDVADALGRDRTAVVHWESGRHLPEASVLPALARVLHVSIDDLMAEPEPMPEPDGTPIKAVGE